MKQRLYCPGCGTALSRKYFDYIEEELPDDRYMTRCDNCATRYLVQEHYITTSEEV